MATDTEAGINFTRRTLLAGAGSLLVNRSAAAAAEPSEPILLPDLPIIDPHHHLWEANAALKRPAYLVEDLVRDMDDGHRIVATVFIEVGSHYRKDGPAELRPVGEVEWVIEQSRRDKRVARGIVGFADLGGANAAQALEALVAASEGRLKGIRQSAPYDASQLNPMSERARTLYGDPAFRAGLARLGAMGLSFDAWCYHTTLPQVGSRQE
jgi:predicted TIM-barrel fold metal-dependent hydrolase